MDERPLQVPLDYSPPFPPVVPVNVQQLMATGGAIFLVHVLSTFGCYWLCLLVGNSIVQIVLIVIVPNVLPAIGYRKVFRSYAASTHLTQSPRFWLTFWLTCIVLFLSWWGSMLLPVNVFGA